ncbi:hypothetical protein C6I20_03835 [Aeromicrobium sp. A1-2]|uniref:copper chaperone PCu(A)C n=1 Tax=Aeromicrobium sp. A1-2 TaxID=2107713 RepID=UPI000E4D1D04|nr:copper chaperone PCu(A)C [Aeromicrobium sp. A1-2]AXT84410.1 hypothetical protein C6I20_03835 [Aeromicrobium sp. A1-2]
MNMRTARPTSTRRLTSLTAAAVAVVASLGLTACGSSGADVATQASGIVIEDPWVKEADSGMTAAFGVLRNDSDTEAVVVSATSPSTSSMELHEMAPHDDGDMVMRAKKGGVTIPAGGTHTLDPGADHLMLMDVTKPIKAGDTVTVTLTFADKSTMKFTAPARTFAGANEDYQGDDKSGTDMSEMGDE